MFTVAAPLRQATQKKKQTASPEDLERVFPAVRFRARRQEQTLGHFEVMFERRFLSFYYILFKGVFWM